MSHAKQASHPVLEKETYFFPRHSQLLPLHEIPCPPLKRTQPLYHNEGTESRYYAFPHHTGVESENNSPTVPKALEIWAHYARQKNKRNSILYDDAVHVSLWWRVYYADRVLKSSEFHQRMSKILCIARRV